MRRGNSRRAGAPRKHRAAVTEGQTAPPDTARRKVLLGVGGGIAAYKSCELVRHLIARGHAVRVVMTRRATEFVTPLTFAALSGHPVGLDGFGAEAFRMEHIELARWSDAMAIAPATADLLSKLAAGAADELLTATYVTFDREVLAAPAMNRTMWQHPATQANCRRLEARGVRLIGPRDGDLACGEVGPGAMAEPEEIAREIEALLGPGRDLTGRRVLVTAGPTMEYLDPVRYLANPSSGLMGLELAREAVARGATACVVHGPLPGGWRPAGVTTESVTSAQEMYDAVMARLADADVFIGAAAVSDFRPARRSAQKLKKGGRTQFTLKLVATPDILAAAGRARRPGQVIVGFALESGDLLANAAAKLAAKRADLIVANGVTDDGFPFGSRDTRVVLLGAGGCARELPRMSKRLVARAVLDEVRGLLGG